MAVCCQENLVYMLLQNLLTKSKLSCNSSIETPASTLLVSAHLTKASVAKLAPEPGENGQPPKPPMLESNSVIP